MAELLSDEQFEIAIGLVSASLRFADWAAGEGICPIDSDIPDPETFLFDACRALDRDDWPPMIEMVVAGLRSERDRAAALETELAALRSAQAALLTTDAYLVEMLAKMGERVR